MKELSIEEKARLYDEAKYIMKEYLESGNAGVIAENTIKKAFPELKESEDERIRTLIISSIKNDMTVGSTKNKEECIAWLEKQGEQKPADNIESSAQNKPWSKEDEEMFIEIILDLKALKNRDTGEAGKAAYQREIDWLESLRPQLQWMPSDEQMDALHYVTNFDYGGHKATLVSLYEQLKKLKG